MWVGPGCGRGLNVKLKHSELDSVGMLSQIHILTLIETTVD
jgi:hypothetical protein